MTLHVKTAILKNMLANKQNKKKRKPLDSAYRELFENADLVSHLIENYFKKFDKKFPWASELDLSTLTPVPLKFISEHLVKREGDCAWKIKWNNQDLYLIFWLEF